MELRLWGVRGSIPAPGPDTVVHGGNTTCIERGSDDVPARICSASVTVSMDGAKPSSLANRRRQLS